MPKPVSLPALAAAGLIVAALALGLAGATLLGCLLCLAALVPAGVVTVRGLQDEGQGRAALGIVLLVGALIAGGVVILARLLSWLS